METRRTRKTMALTGISSPVTATKSTPVTPVESTQSDESVVVMRPRSPSKLNSLVVVPRQISDHSQTTHVTARPNSMVN